MISEFDTLENYTNIAKKTISKFASKFYPGLSKEMLNNDETVAEVASAIMMADWNWDKNRKGKSTGLGKSMYSYRNQCAIWAIKTYITSKFKKTKKQAKYNDYYSTHYVENTEQNPADIVEQQESRDTLSNDMKNLIDNAPISDKQRQQLIMYYYDNKTLADIGREFSVTREAVRQNIQKAINTIRESVNL